MTAFHSPDRTEGSSSNQAQRLLTSIGRKVRPRSPARVVRRHGFDGFVGGDPDQIVSDDCEKTAVSSFEVENFSGSTNVPCFVH